MRITLFIAYAFTHTTLFAPISVVLCTVFILVIVLVKPYKKRHSKYYGRVDVLFMSFLVLWNASLASIDTGSLKAQPPILAGFSGILPVLYTPLLLLLRFLRTNKCFGEDSFVQFPFSERKYHHIDRDSEENRALSGSEEVVNYGSLTSAYNYDVANS